MIPLGRKVLAIIFDQRERIMVSILMVVFAFFTLTESWWGLHKVVPLLPENLYVRFWTTFVFYGGVVMSFLLMVLSVLITSRNITSANANLGREGVDLSIQNDDTEDKEKDMIDIVGTKAKALLKRKRGEKVGKM